MAPEAMAARAKAPFIGSTGPPVSCRWTGAAAAGITQQPLPCQASTRSSRLWARSVYPPLRCGRRLSYGFSSASYRCGERGRGAATKAPLPYVISTSPSTHSMRRTGRAVTQTLGWDTPAERLRQLMRIPH